MSSIKFNCAALILLAVAAIVSNSSGEFVPGNAAKIPPGAKRITQEALATAEFQQWLQVQGEKTVDKIMDQISTPEDSSSQREAKIQVARYLVNVTFTAMTRRLQNYGKFLDQVMSNETVTSTEVPSNPVTEESTEAEATPTSASVVPLKEKQPLPFSIPSLEATPPSQNESDITPVFVPISMMIPESSPNTNQTETVVMMMSRPIWEQILSFNFSSFVSGAVGGTRLPFNVSFAAFRLPAMSGNATTGNGTMPFRLPFNLTALAAGGPPPLPFNLTLPPRPPPLSLNFTIPLPSVPAAPAGANRTSPFGLPPLPFNFSLPSGAAGVALPFNLSLPMAGGMLPFNLTFPPGGGSLPFNLSFPMRDASGGNQTFRLPFNITFPPSGAPAPFNFSALGIPGLSPTEAGPRPLFNLSFPTEGIAIGFLNFNTTTTQTENGGNQTGLNLSLNLDLAPPEDFLQFPPPPEMNDSVKISQTQLASQVDQLVTGINTQNFTGVVDSTLNIATPTTIGVLVNALLNIVLCNPIDRWNGHCGI